jgi:hypothetical protein
MNKNVLYTLIGIVVIIGAFFYLMGKINSYTNGIQEIKSTEGTKKTTATTTKKTTPRGTVSTGATSYLYGFTGPASCTFYNEISTGNSVQGTVYTANGKLRVDLNIIANNNVNYSHAIVDSTYVYRWNDAEKTGTKTLKANMPHLTLNDVNIDLVPNMLCTVKSISGVDFGKFTIPTGIRF